MIKVVKTGMLCSIQDSGRFGYRHMGVPISGWMDDRSALAANTILGNLEDDAMIEMGLIGMELLFLEETSIVLCGAPKLAILNDQSVYFNERIEISMGDVLKVKSSKSGVWTYMAVAGGIKNEKELGSRSTYDLAKVGTSLEKGTEVLFHKKEKGKKVSLRSRVKVETTFHINTIRVRKGPEFDKLSSDQKSVILNEPFSIGNKSDRMGYFLDSQNTSLLNGISGIITSIVSPGTIQLPPSGVPIALMKDCQTTGGYARILQVIKEDIGVLAQKNPGSEVTLSLYDG